jgi:hypothetical protein
MQQPAGQSSELPSGVQARQSWHPPAMGAADSLVSAILARSGSLMSNAARLSAWYEQFIRRVQPWSGWSPLSLELRAEDRSSAGQVPAANHRFSHPVYPPLSSSRHPDRHQSGIEYTGQETVNPHVLGTSAVKFGRDSLERLSERMTFQLTSSQHLPSEPTLSRPAMRLAILRAPTTAGTTTPNTAGNFTDFPVDSREQRLAPLNERILWRSPPIADKLPLPPRLDVSVSPTPRQEIRGGFPTHQPLLTGLPQAERQTTETDRSPLTQWKITAETASLSPNRQAAALPELLSSAPESIEKLVPSPFPHQPDTVMPGSPLPTQGTIEQLIERTILPTALPGLELRLVSPEQQASVIHRPSDRVDRHQPPANGSTPPMPAPAPPSAAPLDVNAIADKVYQKLLRRQQLERERRGLY